MKCEGKDEMFQNMNISYNLTIFTHSISITKESLYR